MKHVAVLMGGWSAEREVSMNSGLACSEALKKCGYQVTPVDVGRNIAQTLGELKPDVCFNALHGRYGEDGYIQGMLEIMGIPYTHSGVLASALAMDKPVAKTLFAEAGIPVAEGRIFTHQEVKQGASYPKPFVVKPLNEGSSVGVTIILEGENIALQDLPWTFGEKVLIETFVPGREIQVAVMGDEALGAVEIRPLGRFYDYEAKYTAGKAEHLMPAPLDPDEYEEALRLALLAHQTLGCRGVSRSDLRFDDTGEGPGKFYMLETNTQPGMTSLSLVPEIAGHTGISFEELVRWIVEDASCDR
ncbi:D-alanine--D-alanine ligase [Sneathiella chungangensis]|uniref:D-alanine--D-alanine ligase n=1 Tax=Sneathiella chungangensis TaxID=1418234 RepID=A0A845MFD8_9PROT|nr:D-alanine--D-alanine ligase [Sneathiella chungangensis]MZR22579.1 D-alanine--D-alanine ligase [Sneathiella chungangensis]